MATIDLGKIKQVFRGTYDNSTAYVPDDLVVFTDGSVTSTYICTTATTIPSTLVVIVPTPAVCVILLTLISDAI